MEGEQGEERQLQQQLNSGIQALRQGDRDRGRALLLAVVEADPRREPAWLWLVDALDDPADQLIALENALTLNPGNAAAAQRAAGLRRELGGGPEPAASDAPATAESRGTPAAEPAASAPALTPAGKPNGSTTSQPAAAPTPAPFESPLDDAYRLEDNPYQCAYCGQPNDPHVYRCRHCRRSLSRRRSWRSNRLIFVLLTLAGLQFQAAFVQAMLMYFQSFYPETLSIIPLREILVDNTLAAAIARAAVWAVVVVFLLQDSPAAFPIAAGAGALDLGWSVAGVSLGYVGNMVAFANGLVSLILLVIAGGALLGHALERERLRVTLDLGLRAGMSYHRRASIYARSGQWALAALHWRQAIARDPYVLEYHTCLADARLRLGRTLLARQALTSAEHIKPGNVEVQRLKARLKE